MNRHIQSGNMAYGVAHLKFHGSAEMSLCRVRQLQKSRNHLERMSSACPKRFKLRLLSFPDCGNAGPNFRVNVDVVRDVVM